MKIPKKDSLSNIISSALLTGCLTGATILSSLGCGSTRPRDMPADYNPFPNAVVVPVRQAEQAVPAQAAPQAVEQAAEQVDYDNPFNLDLPDDYVVQAGDTLWGIAKKFGVPNCFERSAILGWQAANPAINPNIHPEIDHMEVREYQCGKDKICKEEQDGDGLTDDLKIGQPLDLNVPIDWGQEYTPCTDCDPCAELPVEKPAEKPVPVATPTPVETTPVVEQTPVVDEQAYGPNMQCIDRWFDEQAVDKHGWAKSPIFGWVWGTDGNLDNGFRIMRHQDGSIADLVQYQSGNVIAHIDNEGDGFVDDNWMPKKQRKFEKQEKRFEKQYRPDRKKNKNMGHKVLTKDHEELGTHLVELYNHITHEDIWGPDCEPDTPVARTTRTKTQKPTPAPKEVKEKNNDAFSYFEVGAGFGNIMNQYSGKRDNGAVEEQDFSFGTTHFLARYGNVGENNKVLVEAATTVGKRLDENLDACGWCNDGALDTLRVFNILGRFDHVFNIFGNGGIYASGEAQYNSNSIDRHRLFHYDHESHSQTQAMASVELGGQVGKFTRSHTSFGIGATAQFITTSWDGSYYPEDLSNNLEATPYARFKTVIVNNNDQGDPSSSFSLEGRYRMRTPLWADSPIQVEDGSSATLKLQFMKHFGGRMDRGWFLSGKADFDTTEYLVDSIFGKGGSTSNTVSFSLSGGLRL